jgi:hypothetical protein
VASYLATKTFFSLTISDDEELVESLSSMDFNDDLFGKVSSGTSGFQLPITNNEHQSSLFTANTNAFLLDATDGQIYVNQSLSSQEKGKSYEDHDPPLEQIGQSTDDQQPCENPWQTVTHKKKKSSKKNKTERNAVLRVMTEHKPISYEKGLEIMVYGFLLLENQKKSSTN